MPPKKTQLSRILFLGIPLERKCGVSKVQLELSDALRSEGMNVDHLSAWPGKSEHFFNSQKDGSREFDGLDSFLKYSHDANLHYDILHSHSWAWAPVVSPNGRGAGELKDIFETKLVHLFHSYLPEEEKAQRNLLRYADRIIHLTPQGKDTFKQVFHDAPWCYDKLEVVPNMVALAKADPVKVRKIMEEISQGRNRIILYVGRFSGEKGTRELAEAYPLIQRAYPQTRMVFLGDGKPEESEFMKAAVGKNNPNVFFKGWVDEETVAAFQEATIKSRGIQIAPSYYEAFPLATAKALARGCPLAISDIPTLRGIYELDKELPMGIPLNEVNPMEIFRAYEYFSNNSERVSKMTRKGKEAMNREYSPSVVAKKYIEVYERVTQPKP